MQIFAILAFALLVGIGNAIWDVTARRVQAQRLREARRVARPRALPPAPAPETLIELLPNPDLRALVATTREIAVELDALIDRFDLLLLRARARASLGMVFVRSQEPRSQARDLLDRWLKAASALDEDRRGHLRERGHAVESVELLLAQERYRATWTTLVDKADWIAATIKDLDTAVIHLHGILQILESEREDPYR